MNMYINNKGGMLYTPRASVPSISHYSVHDHVCLNYVQHISISAMKPLRFCEPSGGVHFPPLSVRIMKTFSYAYPLNLP